MRNEIPYFLEQTLRLTRKNFCPRIDDEEDLVRAISLQLHDVIAGLIARWCM